MEDDPKLIALHASVDRYLADLGLSENTPELAAKVQLWKHLVRKELKMLKQQDPHTAAFCRRDARAAARRIKAVASRILREQRREQRRKLANKIEDGRTVST